MSIFLKILGWLALNTVLGIMNALLISFYSPEPLPRVFLTAQLNTHTICSLIEIAIYTLGIRLYELGRRLDRPVLAYISVLALAMVAGLIGVYAGALLSRELLDFDPLAAEQEFFSIIYGSILVAIIITAIDRWGRSMTQRRLTLETALQEARLKSLQYRMRPHFFFNTLNTIHATLRRDPNRADRALLMLAANYRFILETAENRLISFADEWEFTRNYIELEHLRFADRLSLRIDCQPNIDSFADVRLPPLLIQPLVENAFVHGARRQREGALIELKAWRDGPENSQVHVLVRDNGPEWEKDTTQIFAGEGTVPHIRERLQHYYPRRSQFELRRLPDSESPDGGWTEAYLSFDSTALQSKL